MRRQLLILCLLTITLAVLANQFKVVFHYLDGLVTFIEIQLTAVFQPTETGTIWRKSLAMMLTPLIILVIPTLFYWAIKQKLLPYFYSIMWIIWLIIATKITTNGMI